MNIMFCGDSHAEDGILIATLSLLKNTSAPLHLYPDEVVRQERLHQIGGRLVAEGYIRVLPAFICYPEASTF